MPDRQLVPSNVPSNVVVLTSWLYNGGWLLPPQLASLQLEHRQKVDELVGRFTNEYSQSEVTRLQSKVAALEVCSLCFMSIHSHLPM